MNAQTRKYQTARMAEWTGTADNINAMAVEERKALGRHLMARYGCKMIKSYRDRLEAMIAGYEIDASLVQGLTDAGASL